MLELFLQLLIIAVALGGISVVTYIIRKKQHGQTLVCPIGSNCNAVVNSEFSRFFGIPLEWIGLTYYFMIAAGYTAITLFPALPLGPVIFPLTFAAFLFSGYLTFIQAFTLREWCTWCLSSAGLSTAIFFLSTYVVNFSEIVSLAVRAEPFITSLHLLGFSLGLGGATIGDIFFFKFLQDLRISERESDTLRTISQVIWFGLGIVVIGSIGLAITDPMTYFTSARFIAKMIVVLFIAINAAFLNLYITPFLVHISFGDKHKHIPGELHHERSLAYASGAISLVSWYAAFMLSMGTSSSISLWTYLVGYFVLIIISVAISQVVENHVAALGYNNNNVNSRTTPPNDKQ